MFIIPFFVYNQFRDDYRLCQPLYFQTANCKRAKETVMNDYETQQWVPFLFH